MMNQPLFRAFPLCDVYLPLLFEHEDANRSEQRLFIAPPSLSTPCPPDPPWPLLPSMDCVKWAQLPEIHPVVMKSCSLLRGRFTGSPSYETTVQESGPAADEERPELPEDVCGWEKSTVSIMVP
jgi:hypothetical protein